MGIKHTPLTYRLQQYIPSPLIRSIANHSTTSSVSYVSEKLEAAVLFADVPGFTPLTETLSQSGLEGTEELSRLINGYFNKIIPILEEGGGEVVKFSGDALTALFIPASNEQLAHALQRANETAQIMQDAMSLFAQLDISIGRISLGLKVSIGVGEVTAMQIGGIGGRWEYVIAGDPLQQISEVAKKAVRGSILLSKEAQQLQQTKVTPVTTMIPLSATIPPDLHQFQIKLMGFIPRPLRSYLHQNMEEWIAELRTMSIVFIGLKGLQVGHEQVAAQLHPILQVIQEITYQYEGTVDKLTVDDKKGSLLLLFGAPPFAYKNSPLRAVRCALDLQTRFQQDPPVKGVQLSIGITSGQVFAGPIGSLYRKTYTVMGDTVNTAARLMSSSPIGSIICDEHTYEQSSQEIDYKVLTPVLLRGKAEKINIFNPQYSSFKSAPRLNTQTVSPLIGRKEELASYQQLLQQLTSGKGHILFLEGEAGIGKSSFINVCIHQAFLNGYQTLTTGGQLIEKNSPYYLWRSLLIQLFSLDESQSPQEWQQLIEEKAKQLIPKQLQRLPLLNDLLPINFIENKLTQSLNPSLRQENLFILFNQLFQVLAQNTPLVLVVDDAHWLDKSSKKMLSDLCRVVAFDSYSILLLIAARTQDTNNAYKELFQQAKQLACTHQLILKKLPHTAIVKLISLQLDVPPSNIPDSLLQLISKQAQGNPFYAEQFILMLQEKDFIDVASTNKTNTCYLKEDITAIPTSLPTTIQGLIEERIDRLAPYSKHVLKIGAVIGGVFSYEIIAAVTQKHSRISKQELQTALIDLNQQGLLVQERQDVEVNYVFKHNFTQNIAYHSLLFAHRRAIHETIAEWYIDTYTETTLSLTESFEETPITLRPFLPLITYHYQQTSNKKAECHFSKLAGIQAIKQHSNQQALRFLLRAEKINNSSDTKTQYEINEYLEDIYKLLGDRKAQAQQLKILRNLFPKLNLPSKEVSLLLKEASYFQEVDDYHQALQLAQKAVQLADTFNLPIWEMKASYQMGELLILLGKYTEAQKVLLQATEVPGEGKAYVRERFTIFVALGRIFQEKGELDIASKHYEKALQIVHQIGDKHLEGSIANSIGVIALNKGEYLKSQEFYERALKIDQDTGDRRGQSMLLHNLASTYQAQGQYEKANEYHLQALHINRSINSRKGECIVLLGLGITHEKQGKYQQAIHFQQQALQIAQDLKIEKIQAYCLMNKGYAQLGLEQIEQAKLNIQASLKIRLQLGLLHWSMESLGALAELDLYNQEEDRALIKVLELIQYLDQNDEIMTLRNMWVCYQVLLANDHPKAQILLQQAYQEVIRLATNVVDPEVQQTIKEKISIHQKIIQEHQLIQEAQIDFLQFKQKFLQKLKDELPDKLYYHGFHHAIDVYKATCRLARLENITGTELILLKTAALLHDSGFIHTRIQHEKAGCQIAQSFLPQFGYSPTQIHTICQLILSTRINYEPQSLSEKIICDADVDYLGRDDFYEIGATLRDELMIHDDVINEKEWQQKQIQFLEKHQYYTQSARLLREEQKQEYLTHIKKELHKQ